MIDPSDVNWRLLPSCRISLTPLRERLGDGPYADQVKALKVMLCGYFSAVACDRKQGSTISPLGGASDGFKLLKVRWALPGGGKSGGLRLAIAVHCARREVLLVDVFLRREDPSEAQFRAAFEALEPTKDR